MVPWHNWTLLGTTDTDFEGDPGSVEPTRAESEYLLEAANRVLRQTLRFDDVVGGYAGLRALAIEPGRSPSANSREYHFHRDPWAKNFVSLCGGKLTTARALGEKLVDQVVARLGGHQPPAFFFHPTQQEPLPGGFTEPFETFVKSAAERAVREFRLPLPVARRIVATYGSRWPFVLRPLRDDRLLAEPLPGTPTLLSAEVDFAVRHEMAIKPEDFLLRRSGLNWTACTLREAVAAVAQVFATQFGWSADRLPNVE
jgi:glycerol-3-phosphate dehydrogenase